MNIGSLCTPHMIAMDSANMLVMAAGLMRDHHVGALIVADLTADGPCVTGIVNDRDLVIDVLARGLDPVGIKVGDLASDKLASVPEEADAYAAIAVMESHGVRRALVTDGDKCVTGIVSLDDLMDEYAKELAVLARVIRSGVQREVAEATSVTLSAKLLPPAHSGDGNRRLEHSPGMSSACARRWYHRRIDILRARGPICRSSMPT